MDLIQAVAELHPRGVNLLEDPSGLDAAALAEWVKAWVAVGKWALPKVSDEKAKSLENSWLPVWTSWRKSGVGQGRRAVKLLKEGYPVDWRIFREYWDLTASVGSFPPWSETIIDRVARRNGVSVPTVYRKRDQVPERIAIITMRLNPDEDPGKVLI